MAGKLLMTCGAKRISPFQWLSQQSGKGPASILPVPSMVLKSSYQGRVSGMQLDMYTTVEAVAVP